MGVAAWTQAGDLVLASNASFEELHYIAVGRLTKLKPLLRISIFGGNDHRLRRDLDRNDNFDQYGCPVELRRPFSDISEWTPDRLRTGAHECPLFHMLIRSASDAWQTCVHGMEPAAAPTNENEPGRREAKRMIGLRASG
ncbi:hypothetical protein [Rhodoblastus sp.]|uniref:hypothetical protein n=1 Tax=Rhodoblastus sp. TaxID=1962975 RepID=UPI0035B37DF6